MGSIAPCIAHPVCLGRPLWNWVSTNEGHLPNWNHYWDSESKALKKRKPLKPNSPDKNPCLPFALPNEALIITNMYCFAETACEKVIKGQIFKALAIISHPLSIYKEMLHLPSNTFLNTKWNLARGWRTYKYVSNVRISRRTHLVMPTITVGKV